MAALLVIKNWKNPNSFFFIQIMSSVEKIIEFWYIYMTEYYTVMRMNKLHQATWMNITYII